MNDETKAELEKKKKQALEDFYRRNPALASLASITTLPQLLSAASIAANIKMPEIDVLDPHVIINKDQSTALRILQEKIKEYEKNHNGPTRYH